MQPQYCDLEFNYEAYNQNKIACQQLMDTKELKLILYKQRLQEKETEILKQSNVQPILDTNEQKQLIFHLDHVSIQNINQQAIIPTPLIKSKKHTIQCIRKSLKIYGINLMVEYFPSNKLIMRQKPDVISSFMYKNSVKWPGNHILKTDQNINKALKNQLKRDSLKRSIQKRISNCSTIASFNIVYQAEDAVIAVKRLVDMMRDQQYTLVYVSASLGLPLSAYEQASLLINELVKIFRISVNKQARIVICCNQMNWQDTIKAFSDKEDQLFLQKQVILE